MRPTPDQQKAMDESLAARRVTKTAGLSSVKSARLATLAAIAAAPARPLPPRKKVR